ncbi:flagellar basal body L-ring protein FlgH [Marinicellulosiphila megalodicopiae]|uniref:flagellar basal body L-ring protein FlgH n=1 Tax=Marinicellulosiphila megalodicopiae TaxID=2724896 RepID=UPI003BB0DC23
MNTLKSFAFIGVVVSSCQTMPSQKVVPDDPNFAPVPSQSLTPPPAMQGSIYSSSSSVQLFSDKNARRVGDIITVMLDEKTTSKKSSNANSKKSSSTAFTAPTIGGTLIPELSANISNDRNFSGSGGAGQSNQMSGVITVTIAEVLPNGVLIVRGEKWITLNNGDEYIRLSGMLRPEDIDVENSVSSQKLADARITYSGTGDLANSNRQGWFSKFLNSQYWPF